MSWQTVVGAAVLAWLAVTILCCAVIVAEHGRRQRRRPNDRTGKP